MGQNQSCPTLQEQWDALNDIERRELYLRTRPTPPIRVESPVTSLEDMPRSESPDTSLEISPIRTHTPPARPPPPTPDRPVSPPPIPRRLPPIPQPPPMPEVDIANSLRSPPIPPQAEPKIPGPALTPNGVASLQNKDPRNDSSEIQAQLGKLRKVSEQTPLLPPPKEPKTLFNVLSDAVSNRRTGVEPENEDNDRDVGEWAGGSGIYRGPYYVKYMKYKNKYLSLKNSMK
jgi:hypothetical protein